VSAIKKSVKVIPFYGQPKSHASTASRADWGHPFRQPVVMRVSYGVTPSHICHENCGYFYFALKTAFSLRIKVQFQALPEIRCVTLLCPHRLFLLPFVHLCNRDNESRPSEKVLQHPQTKNKNTRH